MQNVYVVEFDIYFTHMCYRTNSIFVKRKSGRLFKYWPSTTVFFTLCGQIEAKCLRIAVMYMILIIWLFLLVFGSLDSRVLWTAFKMWTMIEREKRSFIWPFLWFMDCSWRILMIIVKVFFSLFLSACALFLICSPVNHILCLVLFSASNLYFTTNAQGTTLRIREKKLFFFILQDGFSSAHVLT